MNNIQIVLGSLFGDEGKGATVQYLCQEKIKKGIIPLVVRFSGGPQAGHRVIYEDKEHVCSLVGSGVLLNCPTYLGEKVMIDPISLMYEVQHLQQFGIKPLIYIHPYCRVIIPEDVIKNQENSKTIKDGTCGCGIFECFNRNRKYPGAYNDILCATADPERYVKLFNITHNTEEFIKACKWIHDRCIIRKLGTIMDMYSAIIFEGSQGLLLDMDNGFMPNCTPSKVGLNGIPEEYLQDAEVFLVMRSYLTRHGNGYEPIKEPFVREYFKNLNEPTNLDNGPQGRFKIGLFDKDLVRRAFDRSHLDNYQKMYNIKFNTVITHMDCVPYGGTIPIKEDTGVKYEPVNSLMERCFSNILSLNKIYEGYGPNNIIPY